MIYTKFIKEALKHSVLENSCNGNISDNPCVCQSSLISRLIFDIFGGEILKTDTGKKWHFYNRINGERIDFANPESDTFIEDNHIEDVQATYEETQDYFESGDYLTFYEKFVMAFEESVRKNRSQPIGLV
jgi:hypothetical protein